MGLAKRPLLVGKMHQGLLADYSIVARIRQRQVHDVALDDPHLTPSPTRRVSSAAPTARVGVSSTPMTIAP